MIKSKAFQLAALKSEKFRIIGLLCLLGMLLVFVILRGLYFQQFRFFLLQTAVLTLVVVYEVITLRAVNQALRKESQVSTPWLVINVLVETQIPTIALFLLIQSGFMPTEQALVSPAVLLYFLLIILSTLRLSPRLSFLTGLISALSYFSIPLLAGATNPRFNRAVPAVYGLTILAAGGIAALVARQLRTHVLAALREAALQTELERVNHDLDIARSIQQGLLPERSPRLDHFELAGWNQPADMTGGDYFDWQTLPDGSLAISLGDATGHGIGPALVTASCRAYARASFLAGDTQNELLERLNRLLADDLSSNRFVTFAVVFLDPSESQVKILSAGHGPILWYRCATNTIENIEAQGIPLGMIPGVAYSKATEGHLADGDMLALVTDGFYEWENPEGEQFGLKRLENVLLESHEDSAEEIIAKLRSAVATFCRGTKQMDDLTAVVLKRKREQPEVCKTEKKDAGRWNLTLVPAQGGSDHEQTFCR